MGPKTKKSRSNEGISVVATRSITPFIACRRLQLICYWNIWWQYERKLKENPLGCSTGRSPVDGAEILSQWKVANGHHKFHLHFNLRCKERRRSVQAHRFDMRLNVSKIISKCKLLTGFSNPAREAFEACFTPDSRFVLGGSKDGQIHIWNLKDSGFLAYSLRNPHRGTSYNLAVNPKYMNLISSSNKTNVHLWIEKIDLWSNQRHKKEFFE